MSGYSIESQPESGLLTCPEVAPDSCFRNAEYTDMGLYPPPIDVATEVWTEIPEKYRKAGVRSAWVNANKFGHDPHSFLEGPSFDRDGNLYVVDIPFGRVFRISPDRVWTLITEYDGEPNGLKIHKDGRIFVADY